MAHPDDDAVDILLVEDNPGDVRLTREAFAEARIDADLHVVRDGEAALDFLHRRGEFSDVPRPDLVLLDLNLPKVGGMEVLRRLKEDSTLRRLPVVVLTGSESPEDIAESYDQCSNAYLTKPVDSEEFIQLIEAIESFWLSAAKLPPTPK
jgi:chemotaxis family two-component system response regulator Rcp1